MNILTVPIIPTFDPGVTVSPISPSMGENGQSGSPSPPPTLPAPRFCLGNDIFGCVNVDKGWKQSTCVAAEQAVCLIVAVILFVVIGGILLHGLITG